MVVFSIVVFAAVDNAVNIACVVNEVLPKVSHNRTNLFIKDILAAAILSFCMSRSAYSTL